MCWFGLILPNIKTSCYQNWYRVLALSSQLNYHSARSNDKEGIYNIILSVSHLSQVVFCYWGIFVLKTNTNLIHASSIPTTIMNSQEHAKSVFYGKDIRKHQEIQADTQVYSACLIRPKSQRQMHFLPCKYWEENCLRHTHLLKVLIMREWEKVLRQYQLAQAWMQTCNLFLSLLLWIAQLIVIQLHAPLGRPIGVKDSGFREVWLQWYW